ncbi:MAG: FHA domain-containing protein [Victivallaceae bacterium]|nr:FHA domain-containing protein [Victivallaceae bacterium]
MKIFFVVGELAGEETQFRFAPISFGREEDNDLPLPFVGISRYHGSLEFRDHVWYLCDHKSTNGLKLNSRPLHGDTPLREGDLITVGETMFRVTELLPPDNALELLSDESEEKAAVPAPDAEEPPVPVVEFEPMPELEVEDRTVVLPVPEAEAHPEPEKEPPSAESENKVTFLKMAELLKNNEEALFSGKKIPKEATNSTPSAKRRLFSNRLFYTVVISLMCVAMAFFYRIVTDAGDAKSKSVPARPKAFLLAYEKELISGDNIFRFVMTVENREAYFAIDDVKSRRSYANHVSLSAESLDELKREVASADFMKLTSPEARQSEGGRSSRRTLTIACDGEFNKVALGNNDIPRSFESMERAIEIFAGNYGIQTISLTPEELQKQALESFDKAEELLDNWQGRLENLRDAISRYKLAINYLDQFSPRPPVWAKAVKRLEEAEKIRARELSALTAAHERNLSMKNYQEVRQGLIRIMSLAEPESKLYENARKTLIQVDNNLNGNGNRRRGASRGGKK